MDHPFCKILHHIIKWLIEEVMLYFQVLNQSEGFDYLLRQVKHTYLVKPQLRPSCYTYPKESEKYDDWGNFYSNFHKHEHLQYRFVLAVVLQEVTEGDLESVR